MTVARRFGLPQDGSGSAFGVSGPAGFIGVPLVPLGDSAGSWVANGGVSTVFLAVVAAVVAVAVAVASGITVDGVGGAALTCSWM